MVLMIKGGRKLRVPLKNITRLSCIIRILLDLRGIIRKILRTKETHKKNRISKMILLKLIARQRKKKKTEKSNKNKMKMKLKSSSRLLINKTLKKTRAKHKLTPMPFKM